MWQTYKKRKAEVNEVSDEETEVNVDFEGNHLFFYSVINSASLLKFNLCLRHIQNRLLSSASPEESKNLRIYLHIQSEGGDIFTGFALMDIIRRSVIPIVAIIEGQAASAATLMVLGASHRIITKSSFMLIHQLRSAFWGRADEWKDESKNMILIMDTLKQLYRTNTKLKLEKLPSILKHDIYWSAETCLKFGLVDEIAS